jgi:hypothetical protein
MVNKYCTMVLGILLSTHFLKHTNVVQGCNSKCSVCLKVCEMQAAEC